MIKRSGKVAVLVLLALTAGACAELPGGTPDEATAIPAVETGSIRSVPAVWGDLMAVSSSSEFPNLFQLWFQDETGNVRMVVYDTQTRTLKPWSAEITRH